MRNTRSLVSSVVMAALVITAAPVTAQQLAIASVRHSDRPTASDDVIVRPLAIYSFEGSRDLNMPVEITLTDSSGTILGSYRVRRNLAFRPMITEVEGNEVRLQTSTPSGELTIVIYQVGERSESPVLGRWMLGDKQGELLRRSR